MADQDDQTLPSTPDQRQKVSDSFKSTLGPNQPSIWQRLTGSSPAPTPDEMMNSMKKKVYSPGSE